MAGDLIGVDIGSYRLTSTLGVGGMGTVYLAVHPLIGKRVAIKILNQEYADQPELVARFFNEARAVSSLRHPNIVELLDFGQLEVADRGRLHYCVMELLEGVALRELIKRGPLSEATAAAIAYQIAGALAAAHERHVIHRDLKPENVFLVGPQQNVVKVLDFGIAKLLDQGAQGAAAVQTQAGVLLGTPAYMSPEQCLSRPVDARTDVYALGIMLFEMCTGRVPFTGAGYADLLIRQISDPPPAARSINPALSPAIERIIDKALAKDPAGRFQSMEELREALSSPEVGDAAGMQHPSQLPTLIEVHGQPGQPGPSPLPATMILDTTRGVPAIASATPLPATVLGAAPAPQPRPRGLIIALTTLILLGGGGGTYWWLAQRPSHPPAPLPTPPQPGPAPAPKRATPTVRLHIVSQPAGAEVRRADTNELLGTTPLDKELPADGTLAPLIVRKDGHEAQTRALLLTERAADLEFLLKPVSPPPALPQQPSRSKSHKTRPRSSTRLNDELIAPGRLGP